jgi:Tetratricopeptide repeat
VKKKLSWSVALSLLAALSTWASAPPNLERAIEAQQALVERQPESAAAEVDLGNLLLLDGKTQKAEQAYRRALALDAESTAAHFNLALLLQERGDGFAALRSYRRVLKLDREHAWAYYQIGVLQDGWGLKGSAIDSYARALALDPRLLFADINPHVIENRFLTEAMLRSYRKYVPAAQPPQEFVDPRRIAALLLQDKSAAQPALVATAAAPDAVRPKVAGAANVETTDAEGRVLNVESLSAGSVSGQATPSHGGSFGVGGGGVGQVARPESYEPPVFQINTTGDGGEEPVGIGVPYYPGAESTGRLEMKLHETGDRRALG